MLPDADFLLRQKVYDAFRDVEQHLRRHEMIVAVHPDDLTEDVRRMILASPLTTLRESKLLARGTLYLIRPGLLADINGPAVPESAPEQTQLGVWAEEEADRFQARADRARLSLVRRWYERRAASAREIARSEAE